MNESPELRAKACLYVLRDTLSRLRIADADQDARLLRRIQLTKDRQPADHVVLAIRGIDHETGAAQSIARSREIFNELLCLARKTMCAVDDDVLHQTTPVILPPS
jgi:hypothetical protein